MNTTSDYLFVYGTLRPGFDNAFAQYLRQRSRYVGEGSFPGLLYDLGNYPGAVYQDDSATLVVGSIYDISKNRDAILTYLDYYEGVGPEFEAPTEYIRTIIPVISNDNTFASWIYIYNHPTNGKPLILSGDYKIEPGFF